MFLNLWSNIVYICYMDTVVIDIIAEISKTSRVRTCNRNMHGGSINVRTLEITFWHHQELQIFSTLNVGWILSYLTKFVTSGNIKRSDIFEHSIDSSYVRTTRRIFSQDAYFARVISTNVPYAYWFTHVWVRLSEVSISSDAHTYGELSASMGALQPIWGGAFVRD